MTQGATAPWPIERRQPAELPPAPVVVSVEDRSPRLAEELLQGLAPAQPGLVLVFSSDAKLLIPLSQDLAKGLPEGCRIVGCSSAGEIGPGGYCAGTVTALGFPAASFRAEVCILERQEHIPVTEWMGQLRACRTSFAQNPDRAAFGILLADGTARHEDVLVATMDAAIPGIPVVGGSAADGLRFGRTCQVVDGTEYPGAAIFLLIETVFTIAEVTFAHFSATRQCAVVTEADPQNRTILQLNAEPAAEEYARMTGIPPERLTPPEFARHPLLLRMGRRIHVRAIRGVTPQGGLELMSTIEAGTILRLGRVEGLTQGFADTVMRLPREPLMIVGFDCILRRLALERAGMAREMSELYRRFNVAGFSTYGEQHNGMHVNQTFVGMAIMAPVET